MVWQNWGKPSITQAVTEPGDWVIVENPCFYGALQALERLRLKALSVATDVKEGIDLQALELALQEYPVKACWLMTNSQNPLGFTLTPQKSTTGGVAQSVQRNAD